jgi:pimeloyl-ACP methyl ester carboxylesterase
MNTWLLLQGLTRETGHWGAFPSMLRDRLPDGARILAIDLPGNGHRNQERSPARIEGYVESCRHQLRALGIGAPVHVLAMSLGAMVAADWARRHPEDLSGCVLVNTSLRPFSPWHRRLRPARYGTLLGLLWPGRDPRAREEAILRLTARQPPDPDAIVSEWVALRRTHPVSGANALRQVWAAARYRACAQPPPVPLLVLSGRRDAFVDPICTQHLARVWRLPIAEHPAAGHDLPLDDGPWVADQVACWVAASPSGNAVRSAGGGAG